MSTLKKVSAAAIVGLGLSLVNLPANALFLQFDDLVTGPTPASTLGGTGGNDYMTADIVNATVNGVSGVNISLVVYVDDPEFIRVFMFNLNTTIAPPAITTTPDIDASACSGADPAGTGPYDLCLAFDPPGQINQGDLSTPFTFFIAGLTEANFVVNESGLFAVAHVQGVQPNCSSWVGARTSGTTDSVQNFPGTGGACVPVPEPSVSSLLSIGLLAMLGAGIANARRRRGLVA
jgi:hypothetical protein